MFPKTRLVYYSSMKGNFTIKTPQFKNFKINHTNTHLEEPESYDNIRNLLHKNNVQLGLKTLHFKHNVNKIFSIRFVSAVVISLIAYKYKNSICHIE